MAVLLASGSALDLQPQAISFRDGMTRHFALLFAAGVLEGSVANLGRSLLPGAPRVSGNSSSVSAGERVNAITASATQVLCFKMSLAWVQLLADCCSANVYFLSCEASRKGVLTCCAQPDTLLCMSSMNHWVN